MKINKILTTGILGATLAIGFSGCSMNEPLPAKQMNTSKINPINIEYKFNDDINTISQKDIITVLISNLSNNSNYRNKTY